MTCFVCTNSWTYMCPTATCLILPIKLYKPMRLAARNAAEESHRTRSESIFNPKSSWAKFFTYTQVWAQCVKGRTSASPELVAGTPACVVLFVSTTILPKTSSQPNHYWCKHAMAMGHAGPNHQPIYLRVHNFLSQPNTVQTPLNFENHIA